MDRPPVTRFHGFTLDESRRELAYGDHPVHLTRKAFDLLALLVARAPACVTKAEIHSALWPDAFVTDATLAGVVKEVRRVLSAGTPPEAIHTVHAVGYRFTGTFAPAPVCTAGTRRCWLLSGDRRFALVDGVNDVGREAGVAIWMDAPEISRRHARIVLAAGAATIEDLGSKNGTRVNEAPLTSVRVLEDGDTIGVGTSLLVFRVMQPSGSTLSADGAGDDRR